MLIESEALPGVCRAKVLVVADTVGGVWWCGEAFLEFWGSSRSELGIGCASVG